jgi:hypothetical protein
MVAKTRGAKLQKGQRLQKWICEKVSDLLDIAWGVDEQIASRESGQPGVDIRLVADAKKRFPYSVECKNQERWDVHSWIEQAKANQIEGTNWIIVAKRNHKDPVIMLDANAFFGILKESKTNKGGS